MGVLGRTFDVRVSKIEPGPAPRSLGPPSLTLDLASGVYPDGAPLEHVYVTQYRRRTSLAERCTSMLPPPEPTPADLMLCAWPAAPSSEEGSEESSEHSSEFTCALGRRLRARGGPSLRTALRVNLHYVYCHRLFNSIEHLLLVLLDPLLEVAVRKERLLERLACQRAQGVAGRKHLMREIRGDQYYYVGDQRRSEEIREIVRGAQGVAGRTAPWRWRCARSCCRRMRQPGPSSSHR